MKILLISNMYPSTDYPNYGVFVRNTCNSLEENGYAVKKVVIEKNNTKLIKLLNYLLFYLKIVINIIFKDYDIIYGHYLSHISLPILVAIKLKAKKNFKLILNAHGNDVVPENDHDEKFIGLVKKILKYTDKLIVPSTYYKNIMTNEYNFNDKKIFVYPSGGIDHDIFKSIDNEKLYNHFNLDSEFLYIGYVSRIEVNKGWDVFLKSAKIILDNIENKNKIRFIVVGDGSEIDQYNQLVDELQIRKYIYKFDLLNQQELSQIYNVIDIFCFTTYRKSESLGLVGLEAMACGCIVIASNMAGPTSYIENGKNGFLVEPQNYNDLAKTINDLLIQTDNYKDKIIENAIQTSKLYDKEIVKKELINSFNDFTLYNTIG